MSFTINFKPQEPINLRGSGVAQALSIALPCEHPDFPKHSRFLTLLCSQSNQISGMNSEAREEDVTSQGPSAIGYCSQCNNLSTTHISDNITPIVRGFLSEFEASARSGCEICRLLLTAISPYEGPGRLKAYIRPGAALNILVKCANKNARYDLFTPIGEPISPWPGIGQARVIALENFADDRLVDILQSWLKDCRAHTMCQSTNAQSISPARIINVTNDQVRIEEPGSLQEPYVALSHCWGGSILPRATKATIQLLKSTIDWGSLTKTFQDAITLTRKLGFHYIWIDSLCIIQDDENDWRVESLKMADIYENAELVVSATGAKDGSEGLFRERKPVQILASDDTQDSSTVREYGSNHKVIYTHGPGECNDKDCPIYICRDTARHAQWDSLDMITQSSGQFNPLLTRAWAFQEKLLATRIVHFADHELVWECKETQRCECMHLDRSDGRPMLERSSDNTKLRFSKATSSLQSSQALELYELWAKVVAGYTERFLTFEKDRLPALHGAIQKNAEAQSRTMRRGIISLRSA